MHKQPHIFVRRTVRPATLSSFGPRDHLALIGLLLVSGNTGLTGHSTRLTIVALIILAVVLLSSYGLILLRTSAWPVKPIVVGAAFGGLLSAQCLVTSFVPFDTLAGFLLRLTIGAAAFTLNPDLPFLFVNYMVRITQITVPLFLVDLTTEGGLHRVLEPLRSYCIQPDHFLLYNFADAGRNSACFWEPGAYGGYLIMSIVLLGLYSSALPRRRLRALYCVLVCGVASSLSTTALIALPIATLVVQAQLIGGTAWVRRLILVSYLAGSAYLATAVPVVFDKLAGQYAETSSRSGNWQMSRMGSLVTDLEYIRERPLLGWGPNSATRYSLTEDIGFAHGNGLSDFVSKFGFVGLAIFLSTTALALYDLTSDRWRTLWSVAAILTILNGEAFLSYPFFLGLMFVGGSRSEWCFRHTATRTVNTPGRSSRARLRCAVRVTPV